MTIRTNMKIAFLGGLLALGGVASAETDKSATRFQQWDSNGDGAVSAQEWAEGMKTQGDARFDGLDADSDGSLTKEELSSAADARAAKHAERLLKRHDADNSGALEADELAAMGKGRHAKGAARMFDRVDADGDGRVTRAEMTEARDPAKLFARLDRNDDGQLTPEEMKRAKRHHGKHHGPRGDKAGD